VPANAFPALPSPGSAFDAGTCDSMGVCRKVAVDEWDHVPLAPPVACGVYRPACTLEVFIFAPTSGGPWPLLVLLPGGPRPPDQENYLSSFGLSLASQGAVAIISSWRQSADFGGGYPTSFEDVACAIGVARRIGPAYGATPDRVTLVGHSLGGWPATLLGLTASPFVPTQGSCNPTAGDLRPDAVVSVDGVINELADQVDGARYLEAFFGGDFTAKPDAWRAADPFAMAKGAPAGSRSIPFVLVQGGADTDVLPVVARSFHELLLGAGYDATLLEVPAADHGSILGAKETIDAIIAFSTPK